MNTFSLSLAGPKDHPIELSLRCLLFLYLISESQGSLGTAVVILPLAALRNLDTRISELNSDLKRSGLMPVMIQYSEVKGASHELVRCPMRVWPYLYATQAGLALASSMHFDAAFFASCAMGLDFTIYLRMTVDPFGFLYSTPIRIASSASLYDSISVMLMC